MEMLSEMILSNLPAILCLVVGFVLVVIEIYLPGFGAPGIIGGILLVAGIWMKAKNAVEALVIAVIIIALLCVALSISIHSAARGRLAKSKLVLTEVRGNGGEVTEKDMRYFVGREGVACTILRPAGIAEFDGVRLNVVSEGEFIQDGGKVRVDRVEGNRIVVSPIHSAK